MKRSDGKPSRPLTPQHVALVVARIRDWPDMKRITWPDVVDLAAIGTGAARYEWGRVALARNKPIAEAYKAKRATYDEYKDTGKLPKVKAPEFEILERRIAALEAEIKERKEQLNNYDDRFARYIYNAQNHGISQEILEAPLLPVDRYQTDKRKKK
ncbi:hypothetical protein HL658_12530 [Azospirillum sp. RWY-5-1]|uniref:Uncharacterized protein n=1 Tax=Azospirillum oleiclasticum TaxID=2735135 RepID=A0ABX2TCU3_9PROT|nr:hypothetical protein [Azospirillum oleiclasticum]NYZ13379.1 hypothetical protein [Azospirillum oleiclasticum]NYZ20540.1 hypothetical protein [Azospirillum oleiclasticum]